jgi:hypothetical protein
VRNPITVRSSSLLLPARRLAPHSVFFLLFNLLYFWPLAGIGLFDYFEGDTSREVGLDVIAKISCIYLAGVSAFLCGSRLGASFFEAHNNRNTQPGSFRLFGITESFRWLCVMTIVVFLFSKILLRPLGVYAEYAFDTGRMTGGVWSFSMFCSESLLLLSVVVLFSSARRNVLWFALLTIVNGVNLLHGTRIFFMIAGIAFLLHLYMRQKLTLKKAIMAIAALSAVVYVVYIVRAHLGTDEETFSSVGLLRPILDETFFSQLSLMDLVRSPEIWNWWGSSYHFFLDMLYFVVPRFLLPQKDQMLFVDRFADLSPLGASSGYAHGLIYFGLFFPVFYGILGMTASRLLARARVSQFWSAIYVYYVCDFLFRIMRDGYAIPIKMLLNALVILMLAASPLFSGTPGKLVLPSQQGLGGEPEPDATGFND